MSRTQLHLHRDLSILQVNIDNVSVERYCSVSNISGCVQSINQYPPYLNPFINLFIGSQANSLAAGLNKVNYLVHSQYTSLIIKTHQHRVPKACGNWHSYFSFIWYSRLNSHIYYLSNTHTHTTHIHTYSGPGADSVSAHSDLGWCGLVA